MKLVIAEKPSMARDIANVLGATQKGNGCLIGNNWIVTWCIGHLVELARMEDYDSRYANWSPEFLPFIPRTFHYRIINKTRKQYEIIRSLLHDSRVTSVINACDAGREGELIFSLIFKLAECNRPVDRLWISSLTPAAIKEGFANLRPAYEYNGLRDAAHARQRADWVVGINATRAQTIVARSQGAHGIYSLGRVQTPTLALVVDRDIEIENFKPVTYYQVKGTFRVVSTGETYSGWWYKGNNPNGAKVGKFDQMETAQMFCERLKSNGQMPVISSVTRKEVSEHSPLLYDLTLLQRTANRRYNLTAAKTLDIAQTLYEKKILTYPRTSSQYITTDINERITDLLEPLADSNYGEYVDAIAVHRWTLSSRYVADKKVNDHHAIIPTTLKADLDQLTPDELKIYDLVARRFISAFYPDAKDVRTEIVTTLEGQMFITRSTSEVYQGWRVVDLPSIDKKESELEGTENDEEINDNNQKLPNVAPDTRLSLLSVLPVTKQTRAPARYSENTLLAAMEHAGAKIDDLEAQAAMKDSGLGTPATRAAIIEKLIFRNFLIREKKFLRATTLGREIIARLRRDESALASPSLTGQWEAALSRMERLEFPPEKFTQLLNKFTEQTVQQILSQKPSNGAVDSFAQAEGVIPCPKCTEHKRSGYLRVCKGKRGQFLSCSQHREICGYFSAVPKNKTEEKRLLDDRCPKCKGVMRLRAGKQNNFLSCLLYPECDGIRWCDDKPKQPVKKKTMGNRWHTKN